MRFNAEEYRRASGEKFSAAQDAHNSGHYAVSHYLSGVAVECLLRAYRWRVDPSWDEKHDIMALVRRSGFLEKVATRRQPELREKLNDLAVRWHISHRYAPSSSLEASLRRKDNLQGARAQTLSANSERMLDIADAVLKYGNLKWNST